MGASSAYVGRHVIGAAFVAQEIQYGESLGYNDLIGEL